MKDKNGNLIKTGMSVTVPAPDGNVDIWNHEFVGTVDSFHDNYVTVVDGDGEFFDVEPERLEVEEDDIDNLEE